MEKVDLYEAFTVEELEERAELVRLGPPLLYEFSGSCFPDDDGEPI